jgi:eukaryotic-like serine/threonine-protein kinase
MHPERWRRVEQIYHEVLECPCERRAALLEAYCRNDEELRRELESLLEAREEAGDFLSRGELFEAVAELSPAPVEGSILGHYRILARLGAGNMGEVYRALDLRLDRHVALKLLPARLAHDSASVARFQLEAKTASALNHQNIVTIYEIGQADGIWHIAAELIDGVTLRERMRSDQPSLPEAIQLVLACADGLSAAHRANIVHRDIKPENIMVRGDGSVKVVDFGLARISQGGPQSDLRPSATGSIVGTPRYMSPEQARGQEVDERTDIFSLAAVLYEMAAGRPAFPGASTAEVFAALLNADPAPLEGRLGAVVAKALAKDRGARYASIEEFAHDLRSASLRSSRLPAWRPSRVAARMAAAIAALLLAGLGLFSYTRRSPTLSEHDTILLADFKNQTPDPSFEPSLKQALAVQLEQSPLLNIFPEARVREMLRLMGRNPDEPVTSETAREICQRQGLKAYIAASIAPIGSHYVITMEAVDGHNGETLARAQAEAVTKESVLKALSAAATRLRRKVGESLASIQKYDALLEVTTSSLDALQAYSLGVDERRRGNTLAALRFFNRAIDADPGFAYAYAAAATLFRNSRQLDLASQYTTKAYAARDRVSERERLRITAAYFEYVTGELDQAVETLKLYAQIYPRDPLPHNNLGANYSAIGQYEAAVEEGWTAMRLDPDTATRYSGLAFALLRLNRFGEAREVCERALQKGFDSSALRHELHRLAFIAGDRKEMERQLLWFAGKTNEYMAFEWQASTAGNLGEWRRSEQHARKAIDAAIRNKAPEIGSLYASEAAMRAAALGECGRARAEAREAVAIEITPVSMPRATLAMAVCGETDRARTQMEELDRRYPKHTLIHGTWLPMIQAAVAIDRGQYAAAVESLRPAVRYEAAADFWPQYLRGQALLRLGRASESAAEFTRILEHRGQGAESVLYPLARLGLARVQAMQGDGLQAGKTYQEFLSVWKQADADLPPVLAAKRELGRPASTR